MSKMDEMIIVAKREAVFHNETLAFQGVEIDKEKVTGIIEAISSTYEVMRRGNAEENPAYKQPIPYAVMRKGEEVFMYRRLSGGGETRLHDKLSIGVGGHMNDIPEANTFEDVLMENLRRELEEELMIEASSQEINFIGLINDDANEVGRVHIGLLVIIELPTDAVVEVREKDQLEGKWVSVDELLATDVYEKLESWSQIATNSLKG
jgi:predicted NUDIX family phosphoesterase